MIPRPEQSLIGDTGITLRNQPNAGLDELIFTTAASITLKAIKRFYSLVNLDRMAVDGSSFTEYQIHV